MIEQTQTTTMPVSDSAPAPEAKAPEKKRTFAELQLRPEVVHALTDMGFSELMEVQSVVLPLVRAGRDIMVQSRTGSGKTAAFGIPFADGLVDANQKFVQAIVLMPTRELALQVAAEIARISAHSGLSIVPVYGGAPMGRQIEQLRAGGQIVCGTPGRVLDHLRRGTLQLDKVKCAVLDECDEMLSMGFQEDIEAILEKTSPERQTLLFSATMPEGIQRLARRFLRKPEMVKLSADFVGVHEIRHTYYSIHGGQREMELSRVLDFENPERALIFCNTRDETSRVAESLCRQGLDAAAISSDLSQTDREKVMTRMRAGKIRFLVATDVAARGIDLENLPCVINYTFPESPEIYIHRTGRTGRAGRKGYAVSLVGPTEVGSFYYLKLLYKIRPEERSLPSEAELRSKREGESVLRLRALLPGEASSEWCSLARRVMAATDGERLIGCLLRDILSGKAHAEPKPAAAPRPAEPKETAQTTPPPPAQPERKLADRPAPQASEERPQDREPPSSGRARPARDRDRGPEDRGRSRQDARQDRRDRPDRGNRPVRPGRAASTPVTASPNDGREFWEVWSEEVGRTPEAAGIESSPPALAPAPTAPAPTAPTPTAPTPTAPAPTASASSSAPAISGYQAPAPGQVRLFLNLGRKDGATPEEIAELLTSTGVTVPAAAIDTMNTHSYINVTSTEADKLCAGLVGRERNGRAVVCEPARPPRRR